MVRKMKNAKSSQKSKDKEFYEEFYNGLFKRKLLYIFFVIHDTCYKHKQHG